MFKESLPSKSDLSKTIVAFANDAGGILILGIKNSPRKIIGLPEDELLSIEEQINNLIFDNCHPIISPDISILNIEERFLIKVQVYRGSNGPYYLKSKGKKSGTYIRVGSSNRPADDEIIQEMERLKPNISFDSEPILDIDYTRLNLEKLKTAYQDRTGNIINESALKKLHLIKSQQGQFKPTNALLLLSDSPLKSEIFPYAKIECGRFKGTSIDTFIDRKTLDGNLIERELTPHPLTFRKIS